MNKNAFIHLIERAAMQANRADGSNAQPWQDKRHAGSCCQHLIDAVRAVTTKGSFQFWLDSFGECADVESFEREEQEELEAEAMEKAGRPFKDLLTGDKFDFIKPDSAHNTFYNRLVKISARKYESLDSGMSFTVGTIGVKCFNIEEGQ